MFHSKSKGKTLESLRQRRNTVVIIDVSDCFVETGLERGWAEAGMLLEGFLGGWVGGT